MEKIDNIKKIRLDRHLTPLTLWSICFVIPAKAGIQCFQAFLDSRLRGNDRGGVKCISRKIRNTNIEIRNKSEIQNPNVLNFVSNLFYSDFEFVSDFMLRDSDF